MNALSDNNGGPAFPTTAGQVVYSHGMTLRDWFAGQALSSLAGMTVSDGSDFLHGAGAKSAARWAYTFADAMLEARK